MKIKKLLVSILTSAALVSLAACGNTGTVQDQGQGQNQEQGEQSSGSLQNVIKPNQDPVNTEKTEETLTVGLSAEPSTLYGIASGAKENEEQIIGHALLDTLVRVNYSTDEVEPNLATEWEWVDDTHLKMKLRDDVTMTDGTPLVADDVVYTCGLWVELNATNDEGKFFVGAKADDEHTVTIEFNTVAPDFVRMLSRASFGIVSEDEVEAAGGIEAVKTNPVMGSGKYKFVKWQNGQSITLERNEDYWNKDYAGYFKTIVLTFTNDAAAREMAVESGDADIAYDMPVSQAATFVSKDSVNTSIYSFGQETHLWYNMGENAGATKEQKVREAFDKALDFDAIAQVGTAGFGSASLSYWDPSCSFYSENYTAEERAVDLEGAKALLEEAGYGDGLEVTALGLQDNSAVLTVIQANLSQIGVKVTLDTPDTAQFVTSALSGDYDLIAIGDTPAIRTPATVMPFVQMSNVDGTGAVLGGPKWSSEEFDTTIKELIVEADTDKATEIAATLDGMVKEQAVCSNLYSEMKATIYAKGLKGCNTKEVGYIDITGFYK